MTNTKSLAVERTPGSRLYILHRVAILLACAAVFYPGFNPGRVTEAINRNVSLFTASISYSSLVSELERALLRGWVQSATFVLIMIASIVLIVGIVLSAVGGCMSAGNRRMRRYGLYFPLGGAILVARGLAGIYGAYTQNVTGHHHRRPAWRPSPGGTRGAVLRRLGLLLAAGGRAAPARGGGFVFGRKQAARPRRPAPLERAAGGGKDGRMGKGPPCGA